VSRHHESRSLAALALLTLAGCGYALVGHGTNVDPSIKRIGVPLFRDSSGKPGLDQKITEKVIEELLKRGRFDVVQTATDVDAMVDGEIVSYTVHPVGFEATSSTGTQTQASRYAIAVTARIRYAKVGQDVPIWSSDSFSFRDEYDVGDASTFFDREEQTIDRLAQSFARNLVAAMLEAF
jgi:Lipopolysaccharide-assembly